MVITETPRSLAISFIRVLMDGYSVYRTSVPDMGTTAVAPSLTAFPCACGSFAFRVPPPQHHWSPVDIDNFTDYRPVRVEIPVLIKELAEHSSECLRFRSLTHRSSAMKGKTA